MTEDGSSASSTLIKTDRLGRMRTSPERRELLLDEFERSGMSGAEFAKMIGIHYTTFAGWRQRRNKRRRSKKSSSGPDSSKPLLLVEAVVADRLSMCGLKPATNVRVKTRHPEAWISYQFV